MHEASEHGQSSRFADAVKEVDAKLATGPWHTSKLTTLQLKRYPGRDFKDGWRLAIPRDGYSLDIDVLVGECFPLQAPKIALTALRRHLVWPHVEKDGILCLLPSEATVDPSRPGDVTITLLRDALQLVADSDAGTNQQDFRDEFTTYWENASVNDRIPIYSLLKSAGESRLIPFWLSTEFGLVADTTDELNRWLNNATKKLRSGKREFQQGAILKLSELPRPEEYPKSGIGLRSLYEQAEAIHLLDALLREDRGTYLTVIAGDTPTGTAYGAIIASLREKSRYPGRGRSYSGIKGFRQGKAPKKVAATHIEKNLSIALTTVERADPEWVHGRGRDSSTETLVASTVGVIGCGSIGSHLSNRLSEAGVGKLILCDPDTLKWANVGRHALSGEAVGSSKAMALASKLRKSYPASQGFDGYYNRCEILASNSPTQLLTCDLIIAATGSWPAEAYLDGWSKERRFTHPVIYCWAEAFAAAGHAVAILPGNGCLQCGFTSMGEPKLRVTSWPKETLMREAGCDTAYQPYSPVALTHIVGVAVELALDCLLGRVTQSTQRVWCGARRVMLENGGTRSEEWNSLVPDREEGNFIYERQWPRDVACPECIRNGGI